MPRLSLVDRAALVAGVRAEFAGRTFQPGAVDCVVMTRWFLAGAGVIVPDLPHYASVRGGRLALKRLGFSSLADLIDTLLQPIPPARRMIGDVALLQAEPGSDGEALAIVAGRKLIGFAEDVDQLANVEPGRIERVWTL